MDSIENWIHAFFGDSVTPTGGGNDLRVNCPFCSNDTKAHLYVSTVKPVAHCFKCEWRGSWLLLVKEAEGLDSWAEAALHLQQPLGLVDYETVADRLTQRAAKMRRESGVHMRMPEWFVPFAADSDSYMARMILNYALRRMTPDDLLYYGAGYCSDLDEPAAWRLVFPIERGYWVARAIISHDSPKYLTPKFPKGDRLFNPTALAQAGTLHVAEGIFSSSALGRNSVAVLGKSASTRQADRIASSRADLVVVAFDADARAGERTMVLADYLLDRGKPVKLRRYAWGDPEDCQLWNDVDYNWGYRARAKLVGL